jgi:LacI family xylobiose transport system transcriptional regulator
MTSTNTTTSGPHAKASLAELAGDAGVSVATVSRVLNGRPGVSPQVRARIEDLLRVSGYSRKSSTAGLIELVFSELSSAWVAEAVRGVEQIARSAKMAVVVTVSGDLHAPGPEWIEGVVQRGPAGVVLLYADMSADAKAQLRARNIPFVFVDPAGSPALDVPSVGSGNWGGGLIATRHLIELGHRAVALVNGPNELMCSRARAAGYRSALEEAKIVVQPELMVSGEFSPCSGVEIGTELLGRRDRPTAVFAASDVLAIGVYEAARRAGIRVPEDLSVVGYDDLEVAQWMGPPLTTVRQPMREMAEDATRLLLRLGTGELEATSDSLKSELAVRLILRESTAPPRSVTRLPPSA